SVVTRTQNPPGMAADHFAVPHNFGAVHEHVRDSRRFRIEATASTRQVSLLVFYARSNRRGIEHDKVRMPAVRDSTSLFEAIESRGRIGELADRFLERNQPALSDMFPKQRSGVVGAAHLIEMRTRIGAPDTGARVAHYARPLAPGLFALVVVRRKEDRAQ